MSVTLTYTQVGDYLLPDIKLSEPEVNRLYPLMELTEPTDTGE